MRVVVLMLVAVLVLVLVQEVDAAREGRRRTARRHHRRRHKKKMVAREQRGPEVKPWKGWRRWWENTGGDSGAREYVVTSRHPRPSRRYPKIPLEPRPGTGVGGGGGGWWGPNSVHHSLADLGGGLYTQWSNWSRCSRRCRQRRRRSCRVRAVCGSAVLKEERRCAGGGCRKRRPFHIIRPEEFSRQPPRNDMRVLLNFNTMFYSRWSRWSPCSRSCLTRRYRSCIYPLFCGSSVVHEEAYCYREGSLCERWYRRNQQQHQQRRPPHHPDHNTVEENEETTTLVTPSKPPAASSSNWESSLPEQCGVSNVTTPPWSLRIIGGRTAQPGEWPWQVVILNRYHEAFCGGTLVAPRWVLTAAHCVRRKLYVRLGEHDLAVTEGPELEYKVARTVTHPNYDSTTVDNDVALLQLPEAVAVGPRVAPVCLPDQGAALPVGDTCTIIGWGKERNTHIFGTDVLHEAEVPIIAAEVCETVYEDYYITPNMFCAGYRRGRVDSCAGDSGGPLLCRRHGMWYIYGITSFGEGCGKRGKFGIYARVSNYRLWVQSVVASPPPTPRRH